MSTPGKSNNPGFLLSLIRNSIILSYLDKFTSYIYSLIKNGLFGRIFSGYNANMESVTFSRNNDPQKLSAYFYELRYGICRRIESSFIVNSVINLASFLLKCRLKVYGAFLASFGMYTAIINLIRHFSSENLHSLLDNAELVVSGIVVFAAIPLIMSKKSLSEGLSASLIGKIILAVTGYSEEKLRHYFGDAGRMNIAFILGILCGIISYWIPSVYILCVILAVIALYIILIRPEVGVLALLALAPWLPTMILAALVGYTTVCYFIKLFRGKRVFKFEPIDIVVAAFGLILLSGGFISFSSASLKPALLMSCLLLGYFLVSQLITTREWLVRSSVVCVISATLVAAVGIFMYIFGLGYSSAAWLDSEMFAGIAGRAVGTLGNPNVFGEYLILVIPIVCSMVIGKGEGLRKLPAIFCLGILGMCLIFTWSRGAWLALMVAAVVFLFMWHRRSVWLIIAGIISIPILPSILPASIISRFTSIGNMADSSTSYRVYIWRASVNMIKNNSISGIGVGEGAWDLVYPLYTYMGIEAAPHSHNLYLQIFLELGIFGIIAFLIFLFMFYQSGFTFFKDLGGNSLLKTSDISERMLMNSSDNSINYSKKVAEGKTQLRISTIGPMCGVFAVLVQGMTDYSWYNYKVYLMFWLVCGLAMAYVRCGRKLIVPSAAISTHTDDTNYNLDLSTRDIKPSTRKKTINKNIDKGETDE